MITNRRKVPEIFFLAAVVGALWLSCAVAGDFSKDALGTTGAQFLELPVGARGAAMGSAQGSAVDDATAIYYNPAALAGVEGSNATFMHAIYFQEISYDFIAFSRNTERLGTLAFGAQYLSAGSFAAVGNTGEAAGNSLSPRDLAISIANAHKKGDFEYGIGVKYISSRLSNQAKTWAADIGGRFTSDSFAFSISAANLGPGLKFREKSVPLPLSLRVGAGYLLGAWAFALDGVAYKGAALTAGAGAEYKAQLGDSMTAAARLGYNSRSAASGLNGFTGFSIGGGLQLGGYNFDYAFVPFGELGNVHLFSITVGFGSDEKKAGGRTPAALGEKTRPRAKRAVSKHWK